MMSSSVSSRCSLPATSALVIAVRTIRRVEERTSSRALMAVVRSARRRSLRALMEPLWQPCGVCPPPRCAPHARRPPGRRRRRRRRRWRRTPRGRPGSTRCGEVTVPLLPAGHRAAAGAAPQRHPHGPRPARQAGVAARPRRPRARPGGRHRRQPRAPRVGAGRARRARAACSTCRASSSSAPTTTSRRACATRCATCCPTPASATPTRPSCRGRDLAARLRRRRLARPDQRPRVAHRRRHHLRLRRRRRPAPELRRPRRGRRPGRPATPTCASASPTRRTSACSTSSPPTGTTRSLAGHTHGGQVCLPGDGALTTNCDIEPARAQGLHRHPADSRPGDPGSSWLHVSAGLGHQPLRPVPGRVPPRGHPADPGPARLTATRVLSDRFRSLRPLGYARRASPPLVGCGADRAVAQLGSAPRSGRGGRRFKSCQPDHVMSQDIAGPDPRIGVRALVCPAPRERLRDVEHRTLRGRRMSPTSSCAGGPSRRGTLRRMADRPRGRRPLPGAAVLRLRSQEAPRPAEGRSRGAGRRPGTRRHAGSAPEVPASPDPGRGDPATAPEAPAAPLPTAARTPRPTIDPALPSTTRRRPESSRPSRSAPPEPEPAAPRRAPTRPPGRPPPSRSPSRTDPRAARRDVREPGPPAGLPACRPCPPCCWSGPSSAWSRCC